MNAAFGGSTKRRWIILAAAGIALAGALNACGGCDTATGSCEGVEFGLVRVIVQDQEGAPVPNVNSCGTLGTETGQVCGFTQTDGLAELPVGAGMRLIWVEPPEGYVQGSTPLEQMVDVVGTTQVEFMLVRTP